MGNPLVRDALVAKAMAQTGLEDLGDIPFEEPLDVLLASWERDARLEKTGEQAYDNPAYKHSVIGSMEDLNAASLEAAVKTVAGTARSMGLDVVG